MKQVYKLEQEEWGENIDKRIKNLNLSKKNFNDEINRKFPKNPLNYSQMCGNINNTRSERSVKDKIIATLEHLENNEIKRGEESC